jgi:proteic killer suppression protein
MLHASQNLKDLRIPPANRLEKLKGNLSSYHSIRVNQQWRIIFIWYENDAFDVQLVDYH